MNLRVHVILGSFNVYSESLNFKGFIKANKLAFQAHKSHAAGLQRHMALADFHFSGSLLNQE